MNRRRLVPLALAALAAASASGCKTTSPSSPRGLPIPVLDSYASANCVDPGVDANPKVAVVEHRRALADCEARRQLAVDAYDNVRREFGPTRGPDDDG